MQLPHPLRSGAPATDAGHRQPLRRRHGRRTTSTGAPTSTSDPRDSSGLHVRRQRMRNPAGFSNSLGAGGPARHEVGASCAGPRLPKTRLDLTSGRPPTTTCDPGYDFDCDMGSTSGTLPRSRRLRNPPGFSNSVGAGGRCWLRFVLVLRLRLATSTSAPDLPGARVPCGEVAQSGAHARSTRGHIFFASLSALSVTL